MSDFLLKLKGYRTVIVMALTFVLSLLTLFGVLSPADLQGIHDTAAANASNAATGSAGAVLSALAMVLRLFTTGPIASKV